MEDALTSSKTWKDRDPSEMSEYPPEVRGYVESVSHILEDVREVRAIESTVQHNTLNYLGIVDCVARYRLKFTCILHIFVYVYTHFFLLNA